MGCQGQQWSSHQAPVPCTVVRTVWWAVLACRITIVPQATACAGARTPPPPRPASIGGAGVARARPRSDRRCARPRRCCCDRSGAAPPTPPHAAAGSLPAPIAGGTLPHGSTHRLWPAPLNTPTVAPPLLVRPAMGHAPAPAAADAVVRCRPPHQRRRGVATLPVGARGRCVTAPIRSCGRFLGGADRRPPFRGVRHLDQFGARHCGGLDRCDPAASNCGKTFMIRRPRRYRRQPWPLLASALLPTSSRSCQPPPPLVPPGPFPPPR